LYLHRPYLTGKCFQSGEDNEAGDEDRLTTKYVGRFTYQGIALAISQLSLNGIFEFYWLVSPFILALPGAYYTRRFKRLIQLERIWIWIYWSSACRNSGTEAAIKS